MKRPRIYMPRTGIRFARSDAGPPGGFIGGDVQVTTVTGSVGKYLQQNSGIYRFPSVPFTGYPRTAGEMNMVAGGAWTDGFLFDEVEGSFTSSFNSGNFFDIARAVYPETFSQLGDASGFGSVWNAIYIFNQPDGNVLATVGSPTLSKVGTPTFLNDGPFADTKAVGFDSAGDAFSGGDVLDLADATNLRVLWVGKCTILSGTQSLFSKGNVTVPGWEVYADGNQLKFVVSSSSGLFSTQLDATFILDKWHVGVAVMRRGGGASSGSIRMALQTIDDGLTAESTLVDVPNETHVNALDFTVGASPHRAGADYPVGWQFSFLAPAVDTGFPYDTSGLTGDSLTQFIEYFNVHFRREKEGFRTSNDGDYAASFPDVQSVYGDYVVYRANNGFGKLTATGGIMFAFVAKIDIGSQYGSIISGDSRLEIFSQPLTKSIAVRFDLTIGAGDAGLNLANDCYTYGNWFVCFIAIERVDTLTLKSRIITKDLINGTITMSSVVSGTVAAGDLSDMIAFGGEGFVGYHAPTKFLASALYISSGSLSGVTDESYLVSAVNGLHNVLNASSKFKLTGSTDIDNSISSFGNYRETSLLNARLLNAGSGGLGYTYRSIVSPTSSYSPSWSNSHLGNNAAFVIQVLSSSDHEVTNLNLYRSGSSPLETTAVPASASLYYSKKSSLNKITVKKTASYFDTVETSGSYFPETFTAGLGSKLNTVGGAGFAGMSSERITPASIFLNVPVTGKLVDIKVWLELHHTSGSAGGFPLGCLGVALRSPNLQWGMSHPLLNRNDPTVAETFLGQPQNFWTDSFILWEGLGVSAFDQRSYVADGEHLPNSIFREKFAGWDRDLDMRTIFSDGAEVNNPRHNLGFHASGNYVGSPNASLGINSAWGMAISWTGSQGSPPAGWLTGLGGVTSSFNEWPTTGSNAGADFIKPLYPLLDPIQVSIAQQSPGVTYPEQFFGQKVSPEKIIGTRPGLRGTEISGSWQLLFTYSADDDNAADPPNIYFRQARLEITYEEHEGTSYRRGNSTSTPVRPGPKQVWEISGTLLSSVVTASNYVSVLFTNESSIGRTFGIALNTGTINFSDSALVYRLTGSLADTSGSAPGWLLNNRFSMPMIPISSASLAADEESVNISINPQQIVTTRPLLDGPRRLRDAANDAQPQKTRARYAAELISGSLT